MRLSYTCTCDGKRFSSSFNSTNKHMYKAAFIYSYLYTKYGAKYEITVIRTGSKTKLELLLDA